MTEAYPLRWPEGWPRAKGRKGYGAFQVSPEKAMLSLFTNLKKLRVTGVVISSNCKLRNDGRPYAEDLKDVKMSDPGVAVYFTFNGRPMVMAQDAYNAPFANMRSLAFAGVGRRGNAFDRTSRRRAHDAALVRRFRTVAAAGRGTRIPEEAVARSAANVPHRSS